MVNFVKKDLQPICQLKFIATVEENQLILCRKKGELWLRKRWSKKKKIQASINQIIGSIYSIFYIL